MKEAQYYIKKDNGVRCTLCPHKCFIKDDGYGLCQVRKNVNNKLYTENYGEIAAFALDPIEKKPLKHYKSGSNILSIGSYGCNLKCEFCQNYHISKIKPKTKYYSPQTIVELAEKSKSHNNIGLAYTYNEPLISYEFILETAELIKNQHMDNILVTNGFIESEPFSSLLPYINAINIDLKAYNNKFYKNICGGALPVVKNNIKLAAEKCHLEITYLIIPEENDNIDEIEEMAIWLSSISPDIVLHISRFFPNYKMINHLPTPLETIKKAVLTARKYLKNVYGGNIPFIF